jgi:hypothetical protein
MAPVAVGVGCAGRAAHPHAASIKQTATAQEICRMVPALTRVFRPKTNTGIVAGDMVLTAL